MISAVHHIAIIVSSERSLEFYKLLGFTEIFRKDRKYDMAVLMEGHGMQLEIFIDPMHPPHSIDEEPFGLRHFALTVDGSLEEEIERMENVSKEVIEFGPIMSDWIGKRFLFIMRDPDGLLIELRE